LEDLGVDKRIILKLISQTYGRRVCAEFVCLRTGVSSGFL
jgi:hypothetical protein